MIERWGEYTQPELVWKSIPGFFDFKNVYDRLAESAQDGQVFVEVGCLLGRSACYLGERLQAMKKKVTLICVDAWPSTYLWGPDKNTKIEAPFETFLANVRQSGLTDIIFPIRSKSVRAAASIVRDGLDFVFIDAEHDYESCRDDIASWKPKVKNGGTIAGHDYDGTFPGVVQSVNEAFGKDNVTVDGRCWICPVKQ